MLKINEPKQLINKTIAQKARIAIIKTEYHKELNDNLEKYCVNSLRENGVQEKNIKVFIAPGSWEIPLIAKTAAKSNKFDAIITFGVIVKGETYHFEMIANECARAIMQISLDHDLPIAIEILAVYDMKQAQDRAGDNNHNKGAEGALAVLKSLDVISCI